MHARRTTTTVAQRTCCTSRLIKRAAEASRRRAFLAGRTHIIETKSTAVQPPHDASIEIKKVMHKPSAAPRKWQKPLTARQVHAARRHRTCLLRGASDSNDSPRALPGAIVILACCHPSKKTLLASSSTPLRHRRHRNGSDAQPCSMPCSLSPYGAYPSQPSYPRNTS
jgi:hypothetical protein